MNFHAPAGSPAPVQSLASPCALKLRQEDSARRLRQEGQQFSREGEGVAAVDSTTRERLASYMVHAPFSLTRLHYDRDTGFVTYEARACSRPNPASAAPKPPNAQFHHLM